MMLNRNGHHATVRSEPPSGGVLKEFKEAALDVLHEALKVKPTSAQPVYNVYLDTKGHIVGVDAPFESEQAAVRRRKKVFTLKDTVRWAVTIQPERKSAMVHHRSGFRCRFAHT